MPSISTPSITPRLSRSRKVAALAIALTATLLLAGCGNTVTEAAQVGKVVITNDDVARSVREVIAARKGIDTSQMQLSTGSALLQAQFQSYFYSELFNQVADLLKLNIKNSDLESYKQSIIRTVGGDANLPGALVQSNIAPQDFDRTLRQNFIVNELSTIAKNEKLTNTNGEAITAWVVAAAQKVGVHINPRYGTFNYQTGGITAPTNSSAVTPSSSLPSTSK